MAGSYTPNTWVENTTVMHATDWTRVEGALKGSAAAWYVDDPKYGGTDQTGATFSDTAVAAARTAMGTTPGVLVFGPGTYKLASAISTFGIGQGVVGSGKGSTQINYTGASDFIRALDSAAFSAHVHPGLGGQFRGFTLDGSGSTAGACGMHVGDLASLVLDDIRIQLFNGTGSKGLWLDNTVTWTEQAHVNIDAIRNTDNVIFGTHGSYPSFDYGQYLFRIEADVNQNGLSVLNGSVLHDVDLTMTGNFNTGSSNTGIAVRIGTDSTAALIDGKVTIMCETDGASGTGHQTINIGSTANLRAHGVLEFGIGGSIAWVTGNAFARTAFSGRVSVDSNLGVMAFYQANRLVGGSAGSAGFLDGAAAVAYIGGGNWFRRQMTAGALTFSFDSSALTALAGQAATYEFAIQQPASSSTTITWPAAVHWVGGSAPTLSSTPGTYNHIRMVTYDHSTFYATSLGTST